MTDELPERRENDQRLAALERRVTRLTMSSYVKYAVMLALVLFVVVKQSDRSDQIERTAAVAKIAATKVRGASATTKQLVIQNRALVFTNRRNARVAKRLSTQLNRSLCAWRHDLEQRRDTTVKFLKDNPQGFPGVPLKTITDGLANQKRTIRAFNGLDCLRAG